MDIVRSGIILIVYLFVVIILFIVLSNPFEEMVSSFEDVNLTGSDTRVDAAGNTSRLVFNFTFAGFAIIPVVWFVYWVFSREDDWGYRP